MPKGSVKAKMTLDYGFLVVVVVVLVVVVVVCMSLCLWVDVA